MTSLKCEICGVWTTPEEITSIAIDDSSYCAMVCKCHHDAAGLVEKLAKMLADEEHYRAAGSWDWRDQEDKDRAIEAMREEAGPGAESARKPMEVRG